MDATEMLARIDRISEIPTLPAILIEIDRLMQDPDVTTNHISRAIEKDQSMVLKILKLVNSAFYGCLSHVSDINSAVALMGFNTVRNAVLSITLIKTFSDLKETDGFKLEDFWRHALSVATTSRHLAQKSKLAAADQAFVSGLLHDIGKVLLSQYFQPIFVSAWAISKKENLSFFEAEKKSSPLDHAFIGAHLASRWKLPDDLVDTIRWHHLPREDVHNYRLLAIVTAADTVVNRMARSGNPDCKEIPLGLNGELSTQIRPYIETCDAWYPELQESIENAVSFFLGRA